MTLGMPSSRLSRKLLVLAAGLIAAAAVACSADTPGPAASNAGPGGASQPAASVSQSGSGAPVFAGQTFSHGRFDLAGKAGKPVVINFWFPSCPPCQAELPDLQAAYEKYSSQGVEFIGIQQLGLDSSAAGKQFLADLGITVPAFPDEGAQVQAAYKVISYPTTVFLDRKHNIVRKWTGLIDKPHLEENIQAIMKS